MVRSPALSTAAWPQQLRPRRQRSLAIADMPTAPVGGRRHGEPLAGWLEDPRASSAACLRSYFRGGCHGRSVMPRTVHKSSCAPALHRRTSEARRAAEPPGIGRSALAVRSRAESDLLVDASTSSRSRPRQCATTLTSGATRRYVHPDTGWEREHAYAGSRDTDHHGGHEQRPRSRDAASAAWR